MIQPGRKFASSSSKYRYGFNGKENDKEVSKGDEGQQDYGMRVYDIRLGKFLSIDPLTKSYPSLSPYPFAINRPIDGVDLDGLEWIHFNVKYTKSNDGRMIVLEKKMEKDFRKLPESELNKIHKTSSFYSEYSQGFGEKGRGVLFTYEEYNENGGLVSRKDEMEVVSGLTRHGLYAGQGCITKYGELITPGKFGNYDFGMMPIDMADALAKEHDELQNIPNHKGFMHSDYLSSDIIFLRRLVKFKQKYEIDAGYVDPFTGRPVSTEQKKFINNAITLFRFFVAIKVETLKKDLKDKKISQSEYDSRMALFNNQLVIDYAPLPSTQDKLNKGNK